MNKTVHYALVALWEKSGCKIVADCYPLKHDVTYRAITLSTIDGLKTLENNKISLDRGKYTVHVLIGELHYVCLTLKPDCPSSAAELESCSQVFLERLRSIYRELPIMADLTRDLTNLDDIDLSEPLKKTVHDYNQRSETIPILEGEVAQIRKTLMAGLQKLIDRGQRIDELVRKTQTLQIMSQKDFHVLTRTSRRKKKTVIAAVMVTLIFLFASLFVFLLFRGIL